MNEHKPTDESLAQGDLRENWNGFWIWPDDTDADRNVYSLFRRTFENRSPATLTIHITANNFYNLYLDSRFVNRGPVRSHLDSFVVHLDRFLESGPGFVFERPGIVVHLNDE